MTQLLKTTSRLAITAMAGVLATSVSAADLGGNCCTDLEERVSELEATTVRKGNRKVSLQIYGQVSETIMWWNDGAESNVYVQENNAIKNVVGFTGNAKITSDWSAGYKLELQIRSYRSSAANQISQGENNGQNITAYNTQSVALRHAYWELASQTYGSFRIGRDVDAATGTSSINLANPDGFQSSGASLGFANGGFFLRRSGGANSGNQNLSALTWQNFAFQRNGDGPAPYDYAQTGSHIKYTSPFFLGQTKSSGFQASGSWGQDDFWALALRYAEQFGAVRFAAGVGYHDWRAADRGSCSNASTAATNPGGVVAAAATGLGVTPSVSRTSCNAWQASASMMHTPTGLYLSAGGAWLNDDNRQKMVNLVTSGGRSDSVQVQKADDFDNYWWIQGGWETKLNALGKTTFYGTYAQYNLGAGIANSAVQTIASNDVLNSLGATAFIAGAHTNIWGLGVTQAVDAAAMNLYLGYLNFATEGTLMTSTGGVGAAGTPGAGRTSFRANAIDDMHLVYTGATIKF